MLILRFLCNDKVFIEAVERQVSSIVSLVFSVDLSIDDLASKKKAPEKETLL